MKNSWSDSPTLLLFIAITIIGFILWFGLLLLIWPKIAGFVPEFWAMAEAVSTILAAAAVFSAGFIAYRELSEVTRSRHIEVADRLFDELNSPENIEARRWIFQNLPSDPEQGIMSITREGQTAVKQVLNSLDRVAFLTQAGWIPDEVIMPWMHPMIAKSWEKLGPYISYERRRRNEPYYYEYVSELAERCLSWRTQNLTETKVSWLEDAL